jgi:hypothetical protein
MGQRWWFQRFFVERQSSEWEKTKVIETSETDLPTEVDPITGALSQLIVAVIEATATGSPERARAMTEVLAAAERVKAALHPRRLN